MMEVDGGKLLWFRSNRYNLRYTPMLSDGDSKLYNELVRLQPYGKDIEIEKEECINYVSKRLGTALRNLVGDLSKKKVTLGGTRPGRLTQASINSLQT